MLVFRLLGAVAICAADGQLVEVTAAKQRILLTVLLLRANEWVPHSRLIDAIWGGQPPRSAIGNLKTYIWHLRVTLRRLTGSARVQSRPGSYRLAVATGELDTVLFEELAHRGRRALASGQLEHAERFLDEALALWRDEPFDDAPVDLIEPQLARLREHFYSAREQLVETQLARGRPEQAIPMLRSMLAEQPLRERLWAQLIDALVLAGRRAEAVVAYQQVRRLLDHELGLAPGPGIRAAYRSALDG